MRLFCKISAADGRQTDFQFKAQRTDVAWTCDVIAKTSGIENRRQKLKP